MTPTNTKDQKESLFANTARSMAGVPEEITSGGGLASAKRRTPNMEADSQSNLGLA